METLAADIRDGCTLKDVEGLVNNLDLGQDVNRVDLHQYGLDATKAAIERGSTTILKFIMKSAIFQRRQKQRLINEIPSLIYYTTDVATPSSITPIIAALLSTLPSQNIVEAIHRLNEDGFSSLHLAAMDGRCQAGKVLLQLGADPLQRSLDGNTALTLAIACNHRRFWEFILPCSDANSKDEDEDTPLMFAAWRKELSLVTDLIKAGANVNQASRHRSTALWNAVHRVCPAVVMALLKANADMSVRCEGTHLFLEDGGDGENERFIKKIYPPSPRSLLWVAVNKVSDVKRRKESITIIGLLIENGYDLREEQWIKYLQRYSHLKCARTFDIPKAALENADLRTFIYSLYKRPLFLRDNCRNCIRKIHRLHHSSISYPYWVNLLGLGENMSKFLTLNYITT